MSVLGVGKPRWHNFLGDHHLDHGSPRPRLLISEHGERRRLAGPMAGLAVFPQDRRYVLGKGRRRIIRLLPRRVSGATQHTCQQNEQTFHEFSNLTIWTIAEISYMETV